MAELKLHVSVEKGQLDSLKKEIDSIKNKKIKIEVDSSALSQSIKELKNFNSESKGNLKVLTDYYNAANRVKVAELELKKAKEETLKAQNQSKAATEQATTSYNKYRESIEKTKEEELKLQREIEKGNNIQKKSADGMKDIGDAAEQAGKKTQGFISTFVKSAVIYQAIYAIRQAFMDALDTMKEVDSQLVTVRKVTQASVSEINQLRDKAYATASKYGVGAADYLESVAEFARAGYKGQSDALAELSTKTQIVGDTTAEVANQFLLSMDAAYKYNGSIEKLTRVLDGANEIDNNYATSIQKIAEGLGLIAPIASQVHVSEQELTAALGTITAVTQRSGSEAARALRALFLNIIGDTKTEIEDGVTATEESVKSLQGLLKKYAPDAVAAAEATGKIIDPMEAIAALHESMKEGFLTEQELMEQLSSLGGKLRTSQLTALVANFDKYQEMMDTYANSVGSADREVENALDSWDRKTKILANTWTEFIQNSINTDFAKGFLDGLTNAIRLIGNLGNAVLIAGGYFVALKLPAITKSFKELGQNAKTAFAQIKSGAGGMQAAQLAIAGITTAIGIAITAYNAHKQALEEASEKAIAQADAASTEAESIQKAYTAYQDANEAYENGTGTKEALTSATETLASALGDEAIAVGSTADAWKSATKDALEYKKQQIEIAKNAVKTQLADNLSDPFSSGAAEWGYKYAAYSQGKELTYNSIREMGFSGSQFNAIADEEKALETLTKAYKSAQKEIENYAKITGSGKKATDQQRQSYDEATKFIERYSDTIGKLINLEGQQSEIQDYIDGKRVTEYADAMNGAADAMDNAADSAQQAASAYREIEGAAEEAQAAISEFAEATKTEVNDAFKSYADIYSKFLEDWEKGLRGSNTVKAAIDALLPEEAINDLRAKGVNVGELLYNDFYKGIFEAKGEDFGANLAWMLWDNDTIGQIENGAKVIRDAYGEVAATITENEGALSVSVEDFDKLSRAMYEITGIPLDASVWASWMSALGAYSEEIDYTVTDLQNLAKAVGAVNEAGKIDLSKIVTGQLEAGESADKVWDLVDALLDANANGDVELETDAQSVEEAREKVKSLIDEYQKTHGKDGDVEAHTEEAEKNVDGLEKHVQAFVGASPYVIKVDADTTAGEAKIQLMRMHAEAAAAAIANASSGGAHLRPTLMDREAAGTSSAPGGVTLVNEEGPEVIQEGASARIAGGGAPTITWVQPGATIYNAGQTKNIIGNADPSLLFGGIGAFAGGTASGITRWRSSTSTAKAASTGTAVGSSAARGTSTSRINTSTLKTTATAATNDNDRLKQLKDIVSLRESELSLLQAQEAPVKSQIDKNRQIQQALMDEINYLRSIGGSQEEINNLYTKWYKIQKDIADLQDSMYKDLQNAIKGQIEKLNKAREDEKKTLQDQIDAMKEARDTRDEQLELEEKILAVQKAEQNLQNAMTERTVRYFNAVTGQWEWAANASNVKSAAEQLESAQQALMDYQDNAAYNAAIAELEAQQDAIDAKYDDLENRWNKVIDSFEAPVKSIDEALNVIAKNYVPSMEQEIINLNKLIESFGYHVYRNAGIVTHGSGLPVYDNGGILSGVGGIKATGLNEMILPPDITQRMLTVTGGSLIGERLNELRYLYGVSGSLRGSVSNSIGSQHNGDVYRFGNISLSAAQAESMTVAELARVSRNLRLYSANM